MKVDGVHYPSGATDATPEATIPIITAMQHGAKVVKVPQTFEPQRLVNSNLHRGSTVYQVEVLDPTPPGKGVYAIAAKDEAGRWHLGLINLYPGILTIRIVFPPNMVPGPLRWEYYNATLPENSLMGTPSQPENNTLSITLTAWSLNFLSEVG